MAAIHKKNIIISFLSISAVLITLLLFYRNRIKNQKKIRVQEKKLFISEKEKLEKENELKQIQGYIDGQEKEKNRIALELHDGIAGELAGIKHLLTAANTNNRNSEILKVTQDIALITKEVRSLSHTLSSNYILNTSLSSLILELKNKFENSGKIEININIYPENCIENMSNHTKHNLYRILQEILNNNFKHAKATVVNISFTGHKNYISLLIDDDGIGFQKDEKMNGIGFNNIKNRMNSIEGQIHIDSTIGKGTTISIEIPH